MKILKYILTVVVIALFFIGCKYDFVVPEQIPPGPNPDQPVSFATQIVPIFTSDDCVSCHKTGGQSPDLTSSDIYSQIVPALVNTSAPESSLIYDFPAPSTSKHSWKKYSAAQAANVLNWIKEGAQNN